MKREDRYRYNQIVNCLAELAQAQALFVDRHSILEGFVFDSEQTGVQWNDYFSYVLTKSARSLFAVHELFEKRYLEEAAIIVRSAFEAYLALSNLLKNPDQPIQAHVRARVDLHVGRARNAEFKSGRRDHSRIISDKTGEVYNVALDLRRKASESIDPLDLSVYDLIYGRLSHIAHNDFRAFYRYVDENAQFSRSVFRNYFEFPLIALAVFATISQIMLLYQDTEPEDYQALRRSIARAKDVARDFRATYKADPTAIKEIKIVTSRILSIKRFRAYGW